MRAYIRRFLVSGLCLFAAGAVRAETPKVYDGITQAELVAFAKGHGWEAEPWAGSRDVLLRMKPSAPGLRASAILHMIDCDAGGRCRVGLLRSMSYYFIKDRHFLRHWNLTHFGATGFSEAYVTLQRHVHFRGVTDVYLKEVVGEMWAAASARFWTDVEKLAAEERQRPDKSR